MSRKRSTSQSSARSVPDTDGNIRNKESSATAVLQQSSGLAAVTEWEHEHGFFTSEEMDEAHRRIRRQLRCRQLR
jgi:hypothetical protein